MSKLPDNFSDRRVCVMGLGYVGLTLAAVMAEVGFEITGVEIRDEVIESVKKGSAHFFEPGLDARLKRVVNSGSLKVSKHISDRDRARVYIITVGTPLNSEGIARLDMVERVSSEIAQFLRDGDLVVMRSTVKIGTTRDVVLPILQRAGVDFDLVFCPERTLEGQAMQELRQLPQIVGGASMRARVRATQLFNFITPTVVQVETVETAEMIKLVDNASRDAIFALSNEVARLCDAAAINASEVIWAGKLGYPRTNLPWPGPVGGPCLEKDPYILVQSFESYGVTPEIILAARRVNECQPREVADFLKSATMRLDGFAESPEISLMGLAFKGRPETDDLRGTMAIPILAQLRNAFPAGVFRGYDPVVANEQITEVFEIAPCSSLEASFDGASIVVIANNHPAFEGLPLASLAERMTTPGLIYDFWNKYQARDLTLPDGIQYVALGCHGLLAGYERRVERS